ncbi:MAG: HesA/MoeB/ThiF family protein, partial [Pusillimonas sp.]
MDDAQLLRYARHILLDELGIEGQQKLLSARVLVVGAGGLGSPAAMYLAAAGAGHIVLADDDVVDIGNLQRQIMHQTAGLDRPKALSGRDTLLAINPEITIQPLVQRLDDEALSRIIATVDVVLDCCDNFLTRHAVNRACVQHRKPLVSGAA